MLDLAGTRVYVSGDTEDTPEIRNVQPIDLAFVCMNLPFTMTAAQAASAVVDMAPGIVYRTTIVALSRAAGKIRKGLNPLSPPNRTLSKCASETGTRRSDGESGDIAGLSSREGLADAAIVLIHRRTLAAATLAMADSNEYRMPIRSRKNLFHATMTRVFER